MTTEKRDTLLRLAREGLYDRQVAQQLGVSTATVGYYRKRYGLLRGKRPPKHTLYTVYDLDEQYLFEGNVQECAEYLGVSQITVRRYACLRKSGARVPVLIYAEDMKRPVVSTRC